MDPSDDADDAPPIYDEKLEYTYDERLRMALRILRKGCISLLDFLLDVLQSKTFVIYQYRFFSNPSGKLKRLLDCILEDKRGRDAIHAWMEPHAIDLVSSKVAKEMDIVKKKLTWSINKTTPDALLTWNLDAFLGPIVDKKAPILGHILRVAAETKRTKEENKIKSCTTAGMQLAPMLAQAQRSLDLTFNADVRPSLDQRRSFRSQLRIHIVRILLNFSKPFETFPLADDSPLMHPHCRKGPPGHCTKQFPLRTSTIDESSISGNIAVINDVYINQLKMEHKQLVDQAVPSINDQSTNSQIQAAKALRTQDIDLYTRRGCPVPRCIASESLRE